MAGIGLVQKHVYKLVRTHSGECFNFNFTSLFPFACLAQFSLNNMHKGGLQQLQFNSLGERPLSRPSVWPNQFQIVTIATTGVLFVRIMDPSWLIYPSFGICENTILLSVIFTSMSKPSETFIMTTKLLPVFHRNLAPLI